MCVCVCVCVRAYCVVHVHGAQVMRRQMIVYNSNDHAVTLLRYSLLRRTPGIRCVWCRHGHCLLQHVKITMRRCGLARLIAWLCAYVHACVCACVLALSLNLNTHVCVCVCVCTVYVTSCTLQTRPCSYRSSPPHSSHSQ